MQETLGKAFVVEKALPLEFIPFDVVVCGGTLGIFLACALQRKGFRVAVVERGALRGRQQEWNISRRELAELHRVLLLTPSPTGCRRDS